MSALRGIVSISSRNGVHIQAELCSAKNGAVFTLSRNNHPDVGASHLVHVRGTPRFHGVVDLRYEGLARPLGAVLEAMADVCLDHWPLVVDAEGASRDVALALGMLVGYAAARHLRGDAVVRL